jgi:hypothetical protein
VLQLARRVVQVASAFNIRTASHMLVPSIRDFKLVTWFYMKADSAICDVRTPIDRNRVRNLCYRVYGANEVIDRVARIMRGSLCCELVRTNPGTPTPGKGEGERKRMVDVWCCRLVICRGGLAELVMASVITSGSILHRVFSFRCREGSKILMAIIVKD